MLFRITLVLLDISILYCILSTWSLFSYVTVVFQTNAVEPLFVPDALWQLMTSNHNQTLAARSLQLSSEGAFILSQLHMGLRRSSKNLHREGNIFFKPRVIRKHTTHRQRIQFNKIRSRSDSTHIKKWQAVGMGGRGWMCKGKTHLVF